MKRKSLLFLMLMAMFAPLAMNGQTQNQLLSQNFDGNGFQIHLGEYAQGAWYAYNAGSGNNWILYEYSTNNHCAAYAFNSSNAANCYLVSEPFTVSSGMSELSVSLDECVAGSSFPEKFEVFFVKASDVTTLAAVASATHYGAIASDSYTNTTYAQVSGSSTSSALAGQSVRLVVHCTSARDMYRLYIDNITVTETTSGGGGQGGGCDYSEDFEGVTGTSGYNTAGSLPTGWNYIWSGSNTAYAPHVYASTQTSTPGLPSTGNYLGFYASGSTSEYSYAIMPAFAAGEAANHISFKYKFESASNGTLTYGVIDGTDANTYTILGTISNPSSNPGTVDAALNVSQTAGKRIAFRWYKTGTWYTCGIDDICVMTETTSACPTPTNVTVSNITPSSANVSWDGEADSYNVRYRTVTKTIDSEVATFFENFDNSGTGGVPSGWTSSAADYSSTSTNWSIRVYNNTIAHSGSYSVSSRSYDGSRDRSVDNRLVTPQVTLDGTLKFWMKDDGTWHDYIAVYVSTDGNNFAKIYEPGEASDTWTEVNVDLSSYAGQQGYIMIRHLDEGNNYIAIDDFGIYMSTYSYTYGTWQDATPDGILSGLSPETLYEVQVQADCDSDGTSAWTDGVYFETLSACAAPVDLSATNITATTATLGWSDYQDSYNVRYRGRVFFEDFNEGIPSTWTTIDSDGDGYNWGDLNNFGIDNSDCASSASYINDIGVLTPDNWLISPQLDLQGFFEVWLKGQDANDFEEHYAIYLSTVGNTISNFTSGTLLAEGETTNSYQRVTADLSQYAGQQGYIAIRHYSCTNQYWFCVDNFGIYTSDWVTIPANDATVSFDNLIPSTIYVWQVKGANCTNWSALANFPTTTQFVKHIIGYNSEEGNGSGNYYLIASPIGQVAPTNVTNMVNSNHTGYDLFYFDQSQDLEWITYKPSGTVAPGFNLVSGKGYLYANSQTVDLVFNGSNGNYVTNGEETISLDYDTIAPNNGTYNIDLPGWNLVGNPFAVTAFSNRPYYTMDDNGSAFIGEVSNRSVEAMEGIFIEATGTGQSVTFSTTEPNAKSPTLALNLINTTTGSSHIIDRAIVRFDQGDQLHKFQLFKNSTKVYIPKDGQDYAIVCSEEIGEMPVNFKAEDNGTYTLNLSVENVEFGYLHLIDNKTGMDIDLLQTPSYTFEAKTTDYESRFKLVFATGDNSKDDNFAYFSNGSFVINNDGKATLQVIDIMGRILKSENINGCANLNVNAAPGVYMLRLVNGDNVKVQKVVVK